MSTGSFLRVWCRRGAASDLVVNHSLTHMSCLDCQILNDAFEMFEPLDFRTVSRAKMCRHIATHTLLGHKVPDGLHSSLTRHVILHGDLITGSS